MKPQVQYSLRELSEYIDAEWQGDPDYLISGLASLDGADDQSLSFYTNTRYKDLLSNVDAGVILLRSEDAALYSGNKLLSVDPYLDYARLTRLFVNSVPDLKGIHPKAVISESAIIADGVSIAANVVVDSGAVIETGVCIGAGSYIGCNSKIGEGTQLYANVTVYHDVIIGCKCILHSGSVIGADGFGFAPSPDGWQKIHQLGRVQIGDQVEVGASTTIDRGAIDDTIIGDGVKIDNQVQIAHNVNIGEHTAIAGAAAIAGSTVIGKRCTIAGAVGIVGHLTIVDDVHITAMTLVTKSIKQAGSYSSGVPLDETRRWRKNAARFNQLDQVTKQIKSLLASQINKS